MENKILEYLKLIRLDKPTGFLLLFIPCAYGIVLGTNDIKIIFQYLIIFFIGSVLMRSCGCIINDYFDIEFDKQVQRTKNRPLAAGTVTIQEAFCILIVLLFMSAYLLIYLNITAIIICIISIIPVVIYPLIKRISFYPQIFLGFTFNLGLIIAFTTVNNDFNSYILIPYLGFVCWTIFYDTIYGLQDIKHDKEIGVKSFSIFLQSHKALIYIHIFAVLFIILQMTGSVILGCSNLYVYLSIIPVGIIISLCYIIHRYQYTHHLLAKVFQAQAYIGLLWVVIMLTTKILIIKL